MTHEAPERLLEESEPGMAFPDILRFSKLDLAGRRVFLRVDLVTPQAGLGRDPVLGGLQNTIAALLELRCKVVVAGDADEPSTLPGVIRELSSLLKQPVSQLGRDFTSEISAMKAGQVALTPSLMNYAEERTNDTRWAAKIAQVVDVYVNEAPRGSREVRATTVALPRLLPSRGAGPLLGRDLDMTRDFVDLPTSPYVAVVGGSNLASKLPSLLSLLDRVHALLLGGPIANTFLVASGWRPRATSYEPEALAAATQVLERARARGVQLLLPVDGLIPSAGETYECRALSELAEGEAVVDIGHETWNAYCDVLATADTVLWSGALGQTTPVPLMQGTREVAEVAAQATYSGIVGQDTLAMASAFGLTSKISWRATSGDAALELMAGIVSPGIESLRQPDPPARSENADALP